LEYSSIKKIINQKFFSFIFINKNIKNCIFSSFNNINQMYKNSKLEINRTNISIKGSGSQTKNTLSKMNIENKDNSICENEEEAPNIQKPYFIKKKRGRKKETSNEDNMIGIHDKFCDDNIKRKVKSHFHNFIIAFLNMKTKDLLGVNYKFVKIYSEITKNITVDYNQKLFEKKIKDIIIQSSDRFKDKDKNLISLNLVMKNKIIDEELMEILNMNYKDMFLKYYLTSTKKTFEGELKDESYEAHIKKFEKKYGKLYANKYQKNAESLICFYYTCKKRVRKKKFNNSCNSINSFQSYDDIEYINYIYYYKNQNYKKNNLFKVLQYNDNNKNNDNLRKFSNTVSISTQTNMYISEEEKDDENEDEDIDEEEEEEEDEDEDYY